MGSGKAFTSVLLAVCTLMLLCFPVLALAQNEVPAFPEEIEFDEDVGAAATGLGCACMIAVLVFSIASLAIWIAICVYVYRDATARGMENAVLWLILVIVTGLIGLIVYLIVRPPKQAQ